MNEEKNLVFRLPVNHTLLINQQKMKYTSPRISKDEIYLFHFLIPDNINGETFQSLISSFSAAEQKLFNSIQNINAKKRKLFGRLILRDVATLFEINEAEIKCYTNLGKPIFKSSSHLNFNISHSGNLVVCCATIDSPVGIDIEFIRPVNIEIYSNYFDFNEWHYITNSAYPEIEFLKLWVRKEAIIKADGRGMEIELSSLNCLGNKVKTDMDNWYIQEVDILPDFICTIACNKFKKIELFDFNSFFKSVDYNRDLSKQKSGKVI